MKCKDIRWLIALYGSGELSPEEQEMAETHLASCGKCRQELARISGVPDLIQSLHGDTWWADVSSSVREHISAAKGVPPQEKPSRIKKEGIMTGMPIWRPARIGSLATAVMERPIWQRALVSALALIVIAATSIFILRPWGDNNITQVALDAAQNNSQVQAILGEGVPETTILHIDGAVHVEFSTKDVFVTAIVNVEDMRVIAIHREAPTFQPPGPPIFRPELTEDEKTSAIAIAENDPYVQIFLGHGYTLGEPNSSHYILGVDTRLIAWLPLEGTVSDEYSGVIVNLDDWEDVIVMWGGELPSWWPY